MKHPALAVAELLALPIMFFCLFVAPFVLLAHALRAISGGLSVQAKAPWDGLSRRRTAMADEREDLAKTLMFTFGVIVESEAEDRRRIARAYEAAQHLIASIALDNGSARPRILACLERFRAHKEAGKVEAAGWMLAALRERVAERDLRDWEVLASAVDKGVALLPITHLHLQ